MVRPIAAGRRPGCPTLADEWSGRQNGFGLLRLLMAVAVIVSHAFPLGFGRLAPLTLLSHHQLDLGDLGICGFFVCSGLLITRSANRLGLRRFLWHRAVRILPAFWVCLLVSALVAGPLLAVRAGLPLHDYFHHTEGPWSYLRMNWAIGMHQWGISGLLGRNPHARTFDGSLWSLALEVLCYLIVAALSRLGVLRLNRAVVPVLLIWAYTYLCVLAADAGTVRVPIYAPTGQAWTLPLLGWISFDNLLPLMFMFGLGAAFELYRDQLPIHGSLAALAAVAFTGSVLVGGFTLIGLPAGAYLIVWCAVRTPRPLTKVGTRADFSYGLYIYAFLVQQSLVPVHGNRWGVAPYIAISVGLSAVAALCSWYLVERPALRLKNLCTGLTPFSNRLVTLRYRRL